MLETQDSSLWVGGSWTSNVSASSPVTCEYEGTLESYPTVVLYNSSSTTTAAVYSVINFSSRKAIFFNNLFVVPGERIVMQFKPTEVKVVSSFFGDQVFRAMTSSNLSDFKLIRGNNYITAYTGAVTGRIRWPVLHESTDALTFREIRS